VGWTYVPIQWLPIPSVLATPLLSNIHRIVIAGPGSRELLFSNGSTYHFYMAREQGILWPPRGFESETFLTCKLGIGWPKLSDPEQCLAVLRQHLLLAPATTR